MKINDLFVKGNDRLGSVSSTDPLTNEQISLFQNKVWNFYRKNGRSFPWRKTEDPYAILVSEVMLQQTQTIRVIHKFEEWMQLFPTVKSLVSASRNEVLTHWIGLGYNRRAVYLQNACREVYRRFDGVFPRTQDELKTLPGIGAYTAGAVCTFAYNQAAVFIETNIRSVFIHHFFPKVEEKIDDKLLLPLVQQTLDTENPRQWYYALMDFGADLKKTAANPSRKSRAYVKQSRFQGSVRQARGAILRQLSQKKAATLAAISQAESIEIERLTAACRKLLTEKLIIQNGEVLLIREDE